MVMSLIGPCRAWDFLSQVVDTLYELSRRKSGHGGRRGDGDAGDEGAEGNHVYGLSGSEY